MSRPPDANLAAIFTAAFRRHPAGVTVITARGPEGPVGFTASSVASVSLNPVALSFSLARTTRSAHVILTADSFVVHLLAAHQVAVAKASAQPDGPRFSGEQEWSTLPTGEPVLRGAPAALRCRALHHVPVGDSTLVVAEVLDIRRDPAEHPALAYYRRRYRIIDDTTPIPGDSAEDG